MRFVLLADEGATSVRAALVELASSWKSALRFSPVLADVDSPGNGGGGGGISEMDGSAIVLVEVDVDAVLGGCSVTKSGFGIRGNDSVSGSTPSVSATSAIASCHSMTQVKDKN